LKRAAIFTFALSIVFLLAPIYAHAACNVSITESEPNPTNDQSPNFSFNQTGCLTGHGDDFQCKLDTDSWAICTSAKSYSFVTAGQHTFSVRWVVGGLVQDTESFNWTIDVDPPETWFTRGAGPYEETIDDTPPFEFLTDELTGVSYSCRVDFTGSWTSCTSQPHSLSTLGLGSHTLEVKATDLAGNTDFSPASRTFTVGLGTRIESAFPSACAAATPTFKFDSTALPTGTDFECRMDAGSWSDCDNGSATYSSLSNGKHVFEVRTEIGNGVAFDPVPAKREFFVNSNLEVDSFEYGLSPGGLATANQVHVAATNSTCGHACDGTRDGTIENPYCTLEEAFDEEVITGGMAIRIHEGTYTDGGPNYGGTEVKGSLGSPIWIGGYMGGTEAKPLFIGVNAGLGFNGPEYFVLHDLVISGTEESGVSIDDVNLTGVAKFVTIRGLDFEDIGRTNASPDSPDHCLKMAGVDHFRIVDSSFDRCGTQASDAGTGTDQKGDGIDCVGCHHGLIADNVFDSRKAVQVKGGSEDIEITRNTSVYRWPATTTGANTNMVYNLGGCTGEAFFRPAAADGLFEAKNIRLVGNLIEGGRAAIAFDRCIDCIAANNTIVRPRDFAIRIIDSDCDDSPDFDHDHPARGKIINNIVHWDEQDVIGNTTLKEIQNDADDVWSSTSVGQSFSINKTVWYEVDFGSPALNDPGLSQSNPLTIISTHSALFTNLSGQDYTIPSTSPATGFGIKLFEIQTDAASICYEETPSAGAYESP